VHDVADLFTRCAANPIIVPGRYPWRAATVFNPAVILEDGRFYLYERAAGGLRPFHCSIGMLVSDDGVRFTHVSDQPVFTPAMAGSEFGSVQDPRVVNIEGTYYMTYAFRPFAWSCSPTGVGVPDAVETRFAGFDGDSRKNQTRSGIAVSTDRVKWAHHSWATPEGLDDRDVILFPEKINGKFCALRRPRGFVDPNVGSGCDGIRVSWSADLKLWSEPELLIAPTQPWEGNRIGGSTPPIRTDQGWLVFYHGVEDVDPAIRRVCYRVGALLLDIKDPLRVFARTREPVMEPREYYERFGLFIPNVVFPTGAVLLNETVYLYYGACDTCICMATAPLETLMRRNVWN
jgi:beta-1,2-mannobiose phosphorylase / 1,2-beta-oligomannan phosphorylase